MFQLAACPDCGTLQLHRGLDEVEARECRVCEDPVPADEWQVEEEHGSFGEARDRLRRLRDRGPGSRGFSSGPPVPDTRLPVGDAPPPVRRRLRALLGELAGRDEPVPEDEFLDCLGDVGAAHMRSHLLREDLVERVEGPDGEPAYRVLGDELPDAAEG